MIRADGNHLPIDVGVPGAATIRSLLNYARLCGVGNSMRVLARQSGNLLKLARLSYPDRLITALARQRALDPQCRIERLHFYPSGGLARTARWIEAIRAGAFTLHDDGLGFAVDGAAVLAARLCRGAIGQRRSAQARVLLRHSSTSSRPGGASTSQAGRVKSHWIGGQAAGVTPFSISAWKPTRLLALIRNQMAPMLSVDGAPCSVARNSAMAAAAPATSSPTPSQ